MHIDFVMCNNLQLISILLKQEYEVAVKKNEYISHKKTKFYITKM